MTARREAMQFWILQLDLHALRRWEDDSGMVDLA